MKPSILRMFFKQTLQIATWLFFTNMSRAAVVTRMEGELITFQGASAIVSIPQFDPSLGSLVNVRFETSMRVVGNYQVTNNSTSIGWATIATGTSAAIINSGGMDLYVTPSPGAEGISVPVNPAFFQQYLIGYGTSRNLFGQVIGSYPIYGYTFFPGYTYSSYSYPAEGMANRSDDNSMFIGKHFVDLEVAIQIADSIWLSSGLGTTYPDYSRTSTTLQLSYDYVAVPEPRSALLPLVLGVGFFSNRIRRQVSHD